MSQQEPPRRLEVPAGTRYRVRVETMDGQKIIEKEGLSAGAFILLGDIPETWQSAFGNGAGMAFAIAKAPYTFRDIARKAGVETEVDIAVKGLAEFNEPHGL